MARFFVLIAFALLFVAAPAHAQKVGHSQDPDDNGYITMNNQLMKVDWQRVSTNCSPCEALVSSYNDMMDALFDLRYQQRVLENDLKQAQADGQNARSAANHSGSKGVSSDEQTVLTISMAFQDKAQALKNSIDAMGRQIAQLEDTTKNMRAEITRCEKQCTNREYKDIIGSDKTISTGLPFAWRGPYPEVCEKCAKLAARLNELPGLAYDAMGKIENAKADKVISEAEIANARANFDIASTSSGNPDDEKLMETLGLQGKGVYEKTIREQEKRIEAANKIIDANETDLAEIKRNFDQTLALYNKCTPTCPKETGMSDPPKDDDTALVLGGDYSKDMQGCTLSYQPESFVIGDNGTYGTGAALKEKGKSMATGMATSALGGLLGGGGGMNFGGKGGGMQAIDPVGSPGGDSGQSGPDLDKNPLKGKPQMFEWSGMYIGAQAGWQNDGLLVSETIKDSPDGNSTFHSMWLQNQKGERILPIKYYIYEIYRDNKLTFWWTYDHWTNGVHDDHDEGEESYKWRDSKQFKVRFDGAEGAKNSIWYNSGYDTAVKGVRQVGALFPVTPGDLSGCGLNLTTHYTLPSQDPVRTEPMVLHLFNDVPADTKYDALGKKIPVGMELLKF